MISFTLMIW